MNGDAEALAAAISGGGPLEALNEPPANVAEGYALQDKVRAVLGREVIGWKLAQTTAGAQAAAGIEAATVAPLLEGMIVPSDTVFPARRFYKPEAEAEIAIELAAPLSGPCSAREVAEAAAGIRLAIEVADTRYTDKPAMGVPAVIADMNSSAALVVGPLEHLSQLDGAVKAAIGLRLGDGSVVDVLSPEARPDPLNVVAFLTRFLAERGQSLGAGAIITTGTHTPPTPTRPGLLVAGFGKIGRITARLSEPWGAPDDGGVANPQAV